MSRLVRSAALILALVTAGPLVSSAQACPMCKEANETDSSLPRAYMYSILFMLGVPATVFAGFGIGMYRLSKKANQEPLPGEEFTDTSNERIDER